MINTNIVKFFKITFYKLLLIPFMTPAIGFASELSYDKYKITDEDFMLEIGKNDILYEKYDSPISQFDMFFGLKVNQDDDQINFNDLSITVDSKNIREIYTKKLESMMRNKYKNKNSFYSEKL